MKVVTVGRSPQNDVVIDDSKASRHHLQIIQHDNGSYTLSDFGSTNGTYINGKRVYGEVRLNPNDIVKIGNTPLPWKMYFQDEVLQPTPSPSRERPLVEIPSNFNINKNEQYAEVRKRGDDFSVGFFRKMGDNVGNHLGNTIGCIASIIVIIIFLAIIGLAAKGCA